HSNFFPQTSEFLLLAVFFGSLLRAGGSWEHWTVRSHSSLAPVEAAAVARPSVLRTQVRRSSPPVEASLEQSWIQRSRLSSAITRMTKRLATYSGRLPRPPDDSISSWTPPRAARTACA